MCNSSVAYSHSVRSDSVAVLCCGQKTEQNFIRLFIIIEIYLDYICRSGELFTALGQLIVSAVISFVFGALLVVFDAVID